MVKGMLDTGCSLPRLGKHLIAGTSCYFPREAADREGGIRLHDHYIADRLTVADHLYAVADPDRSGTEVECEHRRIDAGDQTFQPKSGFLLLPNLKLAVERLGHLVNVRSQSTLLLPGTGRLRRGDVLPGTRADAAARVDGARRAGLQKRATKAVR